MNIGAELGQYFGATHIQKNSEDSLWGFEPPKPFWVFQCDSASKVATLVQQALSVHLADDCCLVTDRRNFR